MGTERETERIERSDSITVTDETSEITITKIFTPKGERLELRASDGESIRLDAIELESLSWQKRELFETLLGDADLVSADALLRPVKADSVDFRETIRISNEYSEVIVGPVTAADRDAVQIASEPLHYENFLSPTALRAIVEQDHDLFSRLLNQPYGPMDR